MTITSPDPLKFFLPIASALTFAIGYTCWDNPSMILSIFSNIPKFENHINTNQKTIHTLTKFIGFVLLCAAFIGAGLWAYIFLHRSAP